MTRKSQVTKPTPASPTTTRTGRGDLLRRAQVSTSSTTSKGTVISIAEQRREREGREPCGKHHAHPHRMTGEGHRWHQKVLRTGVGCAHRVAACEHGTRQPNDLDRFSIIGRVVAYQYAGLRFAHWTEAGM